LVRFDLGRFDQRGRFVSKRDVLTGDVLTMGRFDCGTFWQWDVLIGYPSEYLGCFVFNFFITFLFGSVQLIKLAVRQLLGARKCSVSYRIVSHRALYIIGTVNLRG